MCIGFQVFFSSLVWGMTLHLVLTCLPVMQKQFQINIDRDKEVWNSWK